MEITHYHHNPVSGISHFHVKDAEDVVPVNVEGNLSRADAEVNALEQAPNLLEAKRAEDMKKVAEDAVNKALVDKGLKPAE
jgi:hypothetical protein